MVRQAKHLPPWSLDDHAGIFLSVSSVIIRVTQTKKNKIEMCMWKATIIYTCILYYELRRCCTYVWVELLKFKS